MFESALVEMVSVIVDEQVSAPTVVEQSAGSPPPPMASAVADNSV